PSQITARLLKAGDKAFRDRITAHEEDNWNRRGCRLGRVCRVNSGAYNHRDSKRNQFGGECRQSIIVTFRPAVFDRYIAPLLIPGFGEALAERAHELRPITGRNGAEEADHRHGRLLCAYRNGPRDYRSADKRKELPPPHPSGDAALLPGNGHGAALWRVFYTEQQQGGMAGRPTPGLRPRPGMSASGTTRPNTVGPFRSALRGKADQGSKALDDC